MSGRAGDEKETGSGKEGEVTGAGSGGTGWLRAPESQGWGSRSGGTGWLWALELQGWGSTEARGQPSAAGLGGQWGRCGRNGVLRSHYTVGPRGRP